MKQTTDKTSLAIEAALHFFVSSLCLFILFCQRNHLGLNFDQAPELGDVDAAVRRFPPDLFP